MTTFEGNANALRIITQNQKGRFEGGFRLTYSTIGSILKYPCESKASEGKKGENTEKNMGILKQMNIIFLTYVKN